jgi:two-component system sensor histidine kinase UhpB
VLVNDLGRRADTEASLSSLAETASEAVRDVRSIARRLHPARLDRLGLSEAVRTMAVDALDAAGIEHEVIVEELDVVLAPSAQLHLYRIAQELVSNVVRHSHASEVVVTLRRQGERLVLEVADDGVGLDPNAPQGLGRAGIEERVRLLGGQLSIGGGLGGRGVGSRVEVPSGAAGADRG